VADGQPDSGGGVVSLVIGLVLIGAAIAIVVSLVAFDRWITDRPSLSHELARHRMAVNELRRSVADLEVRAYNEGLPGMKDPK
jgi:hypothetical protein